MKVLDTSHRYKGGHLVVLAVLGLSCFWGMRAQAASGPSASGGRPEPPELTSIRSQLVPVKMQLIELARRSGLQRNLVLQKPSGLVVILTQSELTPGVLQSVMLRTTGSDLLFHNYTPLESAALHRGGVHRLWDVERLDSELTITATVTVLDFMKNTRRLEKVFSIQRNQVPAIVELIVTNLSGQDPELRVQVMVQPASTWMEEVLTKNIRYLIDTGSYLAAAVTLLTDLKQDRKSSDLEEERKLLLGITYQEWALDEEASRFLRGLAAKSDPGIRSAMAWFYLEKLYYRQGVYEKVLDAYLKAQAHLPQALLAEAHYLVGNSLLYRKSYLKAIEHLSLVPEDSEWYPFALYSSGLAYLNSKDLASTQNQFQKLIESNPGGDLLLKILIDRAHITLGFFLADQERYERALEIFRRVPPSSLYADQAEFGVGWTYFKMGEYEKAVVIFENLASQWPDSPFGQEARLKIGVCYSKLKTYRKAVESYQEALRIYSDRHEKLRTLQDDLAKTPLRNWLETQGLLSSDMDVGPVLSKQMAVHPALEVTRFQNSSGRKSPLVLELTARRAVQEAIAAFEDLEKLSSQVNSMTEETGDASGLASPKQILQQIQQPLETKVKGVLNEQLEDLKKHLEERALQADIALLENFNLLNP